MATVKEINNILRGKTLNWRITKEDFKTSEGSMVILNDDPIEIRMRPEKAEIDVSDYEYTVNDYVVTLTKYVGDSVNVVIPNL